MYKTNTKTEELFNSVKEIASFLWERGWAEANGGNLSINVSDFVNTEDEAFQNSEQCSLAKSFPALANHTFFITGSGKRFRDLAKNVFDNSCLIQLSADAKSYKMIWGGGKDVSFKPTSELPTHLALHNHFITNEMQERVVLHTHPIELIALTHIKSFRNQNYLNKKLWGMLPEIKFIIPTGIGYVPYELPGSDILAQKTFESLHNKHKTILWEMHGCLAVAPNIDSAFDMLDTANKAAKIVLTCLSAGFDPIGLNKNQIDKIAKLSIWKSNFTYR